MPEYFWTGDIWGKVCVIAWMYLIWHSHRKGRFPLKLRGFDTIYLVYTGWRMWLLLGVPFVLMGIPVFVYGMDYGEMMSLRDQPITFLIFWSSVILIPTSLIIATIAQIMADRSEKPKRKAK